ncbi:phage head-tail adapter protein [Virgibacillus sp. AGTR]|uniref:phage head-tail adapter protein n=1 Tax=Virgibacillus sp. AGTR TaxID=2812055 RepID=UPI0019628EE3|nr:phage head-tail adapter protein [Virgibacillus sp. AGTR]MCC2250498.1 phage head-tail adapter protein [Virgibacillus sp. AGTR]QRZ18293.1 phage head-tail adapter protein [Virgibacillus sp. AGTR]
MREFKYKPPRVHSGELRTPVTFYKYVPKEGPEPGEQEKKTLYECMGKIDEVWMKDLEQAKTNGTVEDVTITIRDPLDDYIPTNKHYISIDARGYRGKHFNVKADFPDPQNNAFIKIVGGIQS